MNIYLQVTRRGDPRTAQPADGTRLLGHWKDLSFELGDYRIKFCRQELAHRSSPLTGWSDWSRGRFMWTGVIRNRTLLARKVGRAPDSELAELLRAALERWGGRVGNHLDGAFSLAIVDTHSREVRWVRDPFGGVPAMYSTDTDEQRRGWVGSCLCAFEDRPISPKSAVNETRMASYLLRTEDASERDFFRGVNRLRPAEVLLIELGNEMRRTRQTYWQPKLAPALEERFYFRRLRREFARLVEGSVGASERPCVSLSSGLDSSLIAASWMNAWREQRVSHPPFAATISFPNHPATDESSQVRGFADEMNIELSVHDLEDASALARPEYFHDFWGYGPGVHPGESYETEFLNRLRRASGVSDVLIGVGGEHLFPITIAQAIRLALHRCTHYGDGKACRVLPLLLRASHRRRSLGRAALSRSLEHVMPTSFAHVRWARAKLAAKKSATGAAHLWSRRAHVLATGCATTPGHYFASWDWELGRRVIWREQMRSGILFDEPFQSTSLFALAVGLPTQSLELVASGRRRALMRRLVGGVVPEHIRHAPKHGRFAQFNWRSLCNKSHVVEELLASNSLRTTGLVNMPAYQRAWEQCCAVVDPQNGSTFSSPVGTVTFWRPLSIALWLDN